MANQAQDQKQNADDGFEAIVTSILTKSRVLSSGSLMFGCAQIFGFRGPMEQFTDLELFEAHVGSFFRTAMAPAA